MKCRQCLPETAELSDDIQLLAKFNGNLNTLTANLLLKMFIFIHLMKYFTGEIVCEPPNNNLTKFDGTLYIKGESFSLDNDKMLLRGCRLRNTKWCFGIVVFAGRDTKLMQNSGKTILKRTSLDRLLNVLILGVS